MRKIETQDVIDARSQRNKRWLTLFMLIILLGSTAGYAFLSFERSPDSNGAKSGGAQEQDVGGKWIINVDGQQIYLTNSKEEVANLSVNSGATIRDFSGKNIYISSDSTLAYEEIAYPLSMVASRVQEACYGKCEKNLPEKNCTDSLIVFRQSEIEKVSQQDNCIFIDGNLRSVDAFIYNLFGY